jgi:penicillin-binding protein 1A
VATVSQNRPLRNRSKRPRTASAKKPPVTTKQRHPPTAADPPAAKSSKHSGLGWSVLNITLRFIADTISIPLTLLLLCSLSAAIIVYSVLPDLPDVDQLTDISLEEPLRIYTAQQSLMAEFGIQRRRAVEFNALPVNVVNAFIATEDNRFFAHTGIDIIGLMRAAVHLFNTGELTQGGSTITMQVARNFFLTPEKTFRRKLAELLLALRIEKYLTKEQILELYLNKIFFGHRAYGISAAAELYYQKSLDELTLAETAMLAGLPKAPSVNNPLSNPKRAKERRDYILGRMRTLGLISESKYQRALATPLTATPYEAPVEFEADYVAEMVRQTIVAQYGEPAAYRLGLQVYTTLDESLQQQAVKALHQALHAYNHRHGYHGPEAHYPNIEQTSHAELDAILLKHPVIKQLPAGLVTQANAKQAHIYLGDGVSQTLALSEMRWARRYKNENWRGSRPRKVTDVVQVGDLVRLRLNEEATWELAQVPAVSGALVALSSEDGAIRALMGGYAFSWSKFNRAVDTKRQPGSSFKPFIYATALHQGWTPASLVRDEPFQMRGARGTWRPRNADGKFMGTIRLRLALTKSRNLAAIHLLNQIGVESARSYIQRFGFEPDSMPRNLSMALGSGAASPLEMAAGFAVFANGGYRVTPYLIKRIEDQQGHVLLSHQAPRACRSCWLEAPPSTSPAGAEITKVADEPAITEQTPAEPAIDPRIAYSIHSILQDVVQHGTATRAKVLKRPDLAGKTGTTNDARDSWFAGYQPELVAVAWMGMDDNRPLGHGEWGGTAALGMWIDFMAAALPSIPIANIIRPSGMVAMRINNAGQATDRGSLLEYIREEYVNALAGPAPVRARSNQAVAATQRSSAIRFSNQRTAPRVIDELF